MRGTTNSSEHLPYGWRVTQRFDVAVYFCHNTEACGWIT